MADQGKKSDRPEAQVEEAQGLAETCRRVMSGGMPEGCSGVMREMMSRWVERPRAGEGSGSPKAEAQQTVGGENVASLTGKEKELVAIGAAIGAGCQICTQFHVGAALKNGLSQDEVRWAIDEAQMVRGRGGVAVASIGRRALGVEASSPERDEQPSGRSQALVDIGAAAGCNAGALLVPYLASAQQLGVAPAELQSALEISEVVKEHAAKFLRNDADKALPDVTAAPPNVGVPAWDCCAPAAREEASCG